MADVPERVEQVLTNYIVQGDQRGIEALAHDVRQPNLRWFPAEFERLLRAGGPSVQWWGTKLYRDDWTDDEADLLDRDLRLIWTAIAPGRPYPLNAGGDGGAGGLPPVRSLGAAPPGK
jgi:hypothetical protein